MLKINVPYSEKEEAKQKGAKRDSNLKSFIVENRKDYYKFRKWIEPYGNTIVIDELYIIEGRQKCFHCGEETKVIGIGIAKHLNTYRIELLEKNYKRNIKKAEETMNTNRIQIYGSIRPIPENINKYINERYNYKERFSKTTLTTDLRNCCDNCDVLQGEFYLLCEVDSPFFIDKLEDVKKLKIYRIKLDYDFIVSTGFPASFGRIYLNTKYIDLIDIEIN